MKNTLSGSVDNLKLRFDSPHFAAHCLRELEGKRFEMVLGEESQSVSARQHRYYRGAIVKPLWIFQNACGNRCTMDAVHGSLAKRFLESYIVNEKTGAIGDSYIKSTANLTMKEMAEYIDTCIQYVIETYGIPIEEADPDWRIKRKK